MLKVGSIMNREFVALAPDCPVERALDLMRERKQRHLLVTDHERLVGVLSERDLMARPDAAPRRAGAGHAVEVRDRMSVSLDTVTADESLFRACRRLLERRIGCLPVVQEGRLLGLLSETDFLRLYVDVTRSVWDRAEFASSVAACMSQDPVVVAPGASAGEAFELSRAKGIRHLLVVHDGWLVGMVSDRDILPVIGRTEGDFRKVEDLMTRDFVAVTREVPLAVAAEGMLRNGFHALPVLDDGALAGIVTSADVLRALCALDEQAFEVAWSDAQALRSDRAGE